MFSNSTLISNFMKILPVAAEMLHAERRTDRHYETVAFRSFANASKNWHNLYAHTNLPLTILTCFTFALPLVGTSGLCSKANPSVCKDYDAEYDEVYFRQQEVFLSSEFSKTLGKLQNKAVMPQRR